ncbi:MAG: acetylglutamate kinase, partial [Armatimonadetes bacterium]|nr:acetylglutamate kinase [Armatimonadota bacterium]
MDEMTSRAATLIEALPYIRRWAGKTMVVKYGGAAMLSEEHKKSVAQDLVLLQSVGVRPVIVHGGGPRISELMERLGKKPEFVDGQRVTDAETMEIVQMVLVGLIGQDLVAHVYRAGGKAVTISGKDGQTLVACKRQCDGADLGHVGDIVRVNTELIERLSETGYLVVTSTIAMDEEGVAYNVNADAAAGALAVALRAEKLLVLSDVPGLLRDPQDETTLISELTATQARELLESGQISGG